MSKTNLHKLKATRAVIRSTVTMLFEKAGEARETFDSDQVKLLIQKLETKMKTLDDINEKKLSAIDVEHTKDEILNTETYTSEIEMKLMKLRSFEQEISDSYKNSSAQNGNVQIERQECQNVTGTIQSSEEGSNVIEGQDRTVVNNGIERQVSTLNGELQSHYINNSANYHRLPKLSLPLFNGDVQTWQTFWDSFESTVHQNSNLTDVQKFSYLKNQLEGEAARTVDGFALTHTNYSRAVDLLKERYGQKHKIIHAILQSLVQLPAPSNILPSIRKFYDDMETKIRALESIGKQQETYGDVLVPIILEKLPGEIGEHLARHHGDDNWLLSELRQALFREINIKEAGSSLTTRQETNLYGSAASLFTGAKEKETKTKDFTKQLVKCLLCEDSHVVSQCKKYPNVESKLKVVKEKKLCFNCFRKHAVISCNSKYSCQQYGRKHHTTICQTERETRNSQQMTRDAAVMYTSTHQQWSGVLLKTAITDVCYRDNHSSAAILFDEGAQRSFITETQADELHLPRESSESISLSAFGGSGGKVQRIDISTVYVITEQKEKIPVRVLIVPTISIPIDINQRSDITNLPYLKGLKLAHPISDDKEFPISLLIGADYYWDFIEDKIIQGCGPTAMKSKIGYLLSGPLNKPSQRRRTEHVLHVMVSTKSEEQSLERFWNLESLGITKENPEYEAEKDLKTLPTIMH